MKRIESFEVDHNALQPGVYVSREDRDPDTGCVVVSYDLRFTKPNREPVMDTAAVHAIEHLGATYLRNHPGWRHRVVYFGPMGCRTGFYLLLFGKSELGRVRKLVGQMMEYIASFSGDVPGASPEECGNWHDSDLVMAKWYAERYLDALEPWLAADDML